MKIFERVVRRSLSSILPLLGFDFKIELARSLMRDCGFGNGAPIETSNEVAVFDLIRSPAPLLIDVGAHVGEYTTLLKSRFPSAAVYCFEPSQAHFNLLVEATKKLDGVHLSRAALGKQEGEETLYADQAVSGLASLTKRRLQHYAISMELKETVPVTTLDRFVREHDIGAIDLLKIDVEGHELDVLEGAKETLAAGRIGVVQFEFGGCNLDTRTTFQDFFYFFTERYRMRLFVVTRYGLEPICNYHEIYEQYATTNFVAVNASGGRPG